MPADFSALQSIQNELTQKPRTIASAASISPTTRFTYITGTTPVQTIVPPLPGQYHELIFNFETAHANSFAAGGNINLLGPVTSVGQRPLLGCFNPIDNLWYIHSQ